MCCFHLSHLLVLLKIYIRWKCDSRRGWKSHYRKVKEKIFWPGAYTKFPKELHFQKRIHAGLGCDVHCVTVPENRRRCSRRLLLILGMGTLCICEKDDVIKSSLLLLWLVDISYILFFLWRHLKKEHIKASLLSVPNCPPRSIDYYRWQFHWGHLWLCVSMRTILGM